MKKVNRKSQNIDGNKYEYPKEAILNKMQEREASFKIILSQNGNVMLMFCDPISNGISQKVTDIYETMDEYFENNTKLDQIVDERLAEERVEQIQKKSEKTSKKLKIKNDVAKENRKEM